MKRLHLFEISGEIMFMHGNRRNKTLLENTAKKKFTKQNNLFYK